MKPQKENEKVPTKKKRKKWWLWLPLAILLLLIALIVLLPTIISSEMVSNTLLAKINDLAPGKLDFTDLSMGWFKGISISDLNYQDDLESIKVNVKYFAAKPHLGSILSGKISIGDTVIDEPVISIDLKEISQPDMPSQKQPPTTTPQPQPMVGFPVHQIDLNINNGRFTVTDPQGNSAQLTQINTNLNLRPPGEQTNLDFSTNLLSRDQESKISAQAHVTPDKKTGWSLEGTTGDLSIEIQDLDLASLEPFFAMAGLELQTAGSLAANFKSEIDQGLPQTINGTIKGANLELTGSVLKGDKISTSELNVDVQVKRENQLMNIQNFIIDTDWANLRAAGFIPTTVDSMASFLSQDSQYNLKGSGQIDLAKILSQLPQTLGMKEAVTISSGTINTDFAASQGKIASTASLTGLSGQIDGKTIALSQPLTLEAAVTASDSIITFEKATIGSSFASINLTGTTQKANYNADIDLAKLQTELGQFIDMGEYNFAGQIASNGQVTTVEEIISADSSSTIKNLQISTSPKPPLLEPQVDLDFSLNYDTTAQSLKIDNAALNTSFASINTQQASISLAEAQPVINLPLAINISLQKLQPILAFFSSSEQKMQLAGTAESKISVTSQNKSYRIYTDQTQISDLAVSYPGKETFRQENIKMNLEAEVNPELKTAFVKNIQLQSPQINIQGNFQKTETNGNTELKGKADLDYDWTAIST
ncbi:MAG: translocation/assembly module TamB domain-containing protein, partial [Planctomycetota bacterium]